MALLTWEQQQTIKPWTANNKKVFDQINSEVEDYELSQLLGLAFFQDVQTNPTTQANVALLEGSTYTDCFGNTVRHKGLYYVIAYMNYSKYLGISSVTDTSTGFVQKTRDNAESVNEGTIKRLQNEVRQIALTAFEPIKAFLIENSITYPLYCQSLQKKIYTPKITGIKRTEL